MTPQDLLSIPRAVELLDWPIDLSLAAEPEDPWFRLSDDQPFEVVAGDGMGNLFALVGNAAIGRQRPLLYVCHEGQAGVIAASLEEAIQLFIAAPYWRDLLKFSGGGLLPNMVRALPFLEAELQESEPSIDLVREELERVLGIQRLSDPVSCVHSNVSVGERSVNVTTAEDDTFESLFNTFVPEDNPLWRSPK